MRSRSIKIRCASWLIGLLILCTWMPAPRLAFADTLAASNLPDEWQNSGFFTSIGYASDTNGGFQNTAHSQRFIPSHSGTLSHLTTFLAQRVGGVPLKVGVWRDSGGLPGVLLGERSFRHTMFPTNYHPPNPSTDLDFSTAGIVLEAGTTYHAVFRTDSAVWQDDQYTSHILRPHSGSFGLPYLHSRDGGQTWNGGSILGLEAALQVYVVPEPAAGWALATALAGLWWRRREGAPVQGNR